jgi:chromosomal replication initiator protein
VFKLRCPPQAQEDAVKFGLHVGVYKVDAHTTTLWSKACKHLAETLSKDVFDRWIAVIEPKVLKNDTLILNVANDFYQSWLEENYLPLIRDAMAAVSGTQLKIQFVVDSTKKDAAPAEPPKPEKTRVPVPQRLNTQIALNSKYTFDSFVVGPSNSFAHAAALAVAESPARAYNPLFIYGGVGLGKTHLLQAVGNYLVAQRKDIRIAYSSS